MEMLPVAYNTILLKAWISTNPLHVLIRTITYAYQESFINQKENNIINGIALYSYVI